MTDFEDQTPEQQEQGREGARWTQAHIHRLAQLRQLRRLILEDMDANPDNLTDIAELVAMWGPGGLRPTNADLEAAHRDMRTRVRQRFYADLKEKVLSKSTEPQAQYAAGIWMELIANKLPDGKTVQEALTEEDLNALLDEAVASTYRHGPF